MNKNEIKLRTIIREELKKQLNEAMEGFDIKSVPLAPLENKIKSLTGVAIKFDKVEETNGGYFSLSTTKNLVSQTGIFKTVFKEVSMGTVNAQYNDNVESSPYYWMPIYISYRHNERGSKGIRILTALYHPKTDKWDFELE